MFLSYKAISVMASLTRRFLLNDQLNDQTADDGQPSAFGWDWFDASWASDSDWVPERTTAAALSWAPILAPSGAP
jgi:hypothetical protein